MVSIEKNYLTSFTPGNREASCKLEVSSVPQGAGLLVAKTLISVDGGCLISRAQVAPSPERNLMSGSRWANVPILGQSTRSHVSYNFQMHPTNPGEVVGYYREFTVKHDKPTVLIPHALPLELIDAFAGAGIILPGSQDAAVGLYI